MVPALPLYLQLKSLLGEANYDAALGMVTRVGPHELIQLEHAAPDDLSRLRFRCMISDVLDYGGLYSKATLPLDHKCCHIGKAAEARLKGAHHIHDLGEPLFAKQQCWALMMWGMTYYRSFELDLAMPRFELARTVAEILYYAPNLRGIGALALARAWYCIGLVHRERRDTTEARAAFREALRLMEKGIEDRRARNESTASFEFNMARSAGLGMGWIAYNEANLKEADVMLIMARRLMLSAKAKLISAYLDTLQASIMMSESGARAVIDDALKLLSDAYSTFAPQGADWSHTHYALRCQNEIALAHLRLARTYIDDSTKREPHLVEAERCAAAVRHAATKIPKVAQRSSCRALITEARVKRERALPAEALSLAKLARDSAGGSKLLRVDALIGIGEAEFARGVYSSAIAAFLEALGSCKNDRKDAAACHLHLCQAYLKDNQPSMAKEHFNLWGSMSANLENAFIKDMAVKVGKALSNSLPNFERTRVDVARDGDHTRHLNSLRHWLATTALDIDHGNEAEAAVRLNISVAALRGWLRNNSSP